MPALTFSKSLILILAAALITAGAIWLTPKPIPTDQLIEVSEATIAQEVAVTGKLEAVDNVTLAFETGGKVAAVLAEVGEETAADAVLVRLDDTELLAQLGEARAKILAEEALLAELKRGAKPEEVAVARAKAAAAEVARREAEAALRDAARDSYLASDNAVRNYLDRFFRDPRTAPALNFSAPDQLLTSNLSSLRQLAEKKLTEWSSLLNTLDTPPLVKKSYEGITAITALLNDFSRLLSGMDPTTAIPGTTVNEARNTVASTREKISSSQTALLAAEEKLANAQTALETARQELALKESGALSETIQAQEAKVSQAEAGAARLRAQLAKTALRAPFDGILTKQDAKVGEVLTAGQNIVSLIAEDKLQIKANVPEVDIGKVALGNPVRIRLDAFPGEEWPGKVTATDPAETIIDGVVNYQITVAFDRLDQRLKSGLTANLEIKTEEKPALVLPQIAILETDEGALVRKLVGRQVVETKVTTGITSRDGLVEIISGLIAGDRVLNVASRE